jgi:integrase
MNTVNAKDVAAQSLRYWEKSGAVETTLKPRQSVEKGAPTTEQLADPDNIFALIWRTKQELHKMGLTKSAVRNYTTGGLAVILRRHNAEGLTHYSKLLVVEMVVEIRGRYEQGQISRASYQNLRKASFFLSEMHQAGKIILSRIPAWGLRVPNEHYSELLEMFCRENQKTGALAEGTITTARSVIRGFLFELEDEGFSSFSGVTLVTVSGCMSKMAKRYAGGLQSMLYSVRIFLRFLNQHSITSVALALAIPEFVAPRRVVREGFRADEIDKLLCCVDRDSTVGKRDYAIMMTAIQTGLRAVDIVNLTRRDIDWRNNEIRIVQRKTGRPLSLSLEVEAGNAIADYLLNARPESDLPYIFLCETRPYRPLKNRSASSRISAYMRRTGMDTSIPRRGFHSFRRSFGTGLLESEISLDMLSELLGQTHMDSMKPYLAANEKGLKSCAIGLLAAGKTGEIL